MALLDGYGLTKFELNTDGVREILQSSEVQQFLESIANERCPDGCEVDSMIGQNRVNVRITTATEEAYQDNLENNTLLKAVSV